MSSSSEKKTSKSVHKQYSQTKHHRRDAPHHWCDEPILSPRIPWTLASFHRNETQMWLPIFCRAQLGLCGNEPAEIEKHASNIT